VVGRLLIIPKVAVGFTATAAAASTTTTTSTNNNILIYGLKVRGTDELTFSVCAGP